MLLASVLFAGSGAMIKIISASLPNEMVVFFRNIVGLAILLPWLIHNGLTSLNTRHFRFHLLRALLGLAAMYSYFYAVAHMHLAEAILLNYSTPLFMPFIGLLWLGERIPYKLWGITGLGFVGIALILKPGLDLFIPVSLIGLAAGLFSALSMVNIRRLTRTESVTRIVFYFSFIAALVSTIPLLWRWQTPAPALWGGLITIGVLSTLGQLLLTRAYAHASIAQVGPFIYTTVIFAGLIDWILWRETLGLLSFAGAALVCFAGILTIRHANAAPGDAALNRAIS